MITTTTEMNYTLPQLLKALLDQDGSDLHIAANSPPRLRINGKLLPLDLPPMSDKNTLQLCYSVLTEEQKKDFESKQELDLAFGVKGLCRFRANIFTQKGAIGGVFRAIPTDILSLAELKLPSTIEEMCKLPRGLVLVTGPTGSGKSTTLAAMIDYINSNFPYHIVTVEDPIEFLHKNKTSIVNQREVGADTKGFANALRSCLRQDPDVILVGEMRDLETISLALTAAETGHLVFGTLHTNTAISTINRIIDAFPSHQQVQVRTQLSFSLMAVLSQILVPTVENSRVCALETLILNNAIRNMIREDKIQQIYSAMQIGQESSSMRTMNQTLLDMVLKRKISAETAANKTNDLAELFDLVQKTPGAATYFRKLRR